MTEMIGKDKTYDQPDSKRNVYFNEFNVLMDKAAYLPLVSGLLRAYAETSEQIAAGYRFMPFLYHRDSVEQIISQYHNPSVAAFSVSMWNEQLNLKVAKEVKTRYPDCLIIFGGPNVPHHPREYFQQNPFVDIAVRGEGEEAFSEILARNLESREFDGIQGIAWRHPETNECIESVGQRPQSRDLDVYPSPYLEGLFDQLMKEAGDLEFQQIIETNRGCPFLCTFCFWGQGGLSRKYRYHGIDRVGMEIDWAGQHGIRYVFNADSNFGMHKRDGEIAQTLVDTKKKYGFPQKFRTCFGKNTDDRIFQVAKLLHDHDLEKGITMALQSNDAGVLENIKRTNIKTDTYQALQLRFNETDVPVYTELILGLPGESYHSWVSGIEELLQSGLKNQLFTYMCQIFPNTEMADSEYREKFEIVTQRIPLTEIHGSIRPKGLVTEYEDIVISTSSMPLAEWRRMVVFSWVTMMLHSMKLGFFVLHYLHDQLDIPYTSLIEYISDLRFNNQSSPIMKAELNYFDSQLDRLLLGYGRGREMPEFGPIYWDEEEASLLRISSQLGPFYDEFLDMVRSFLRDTHVEFDDTQLIEAVQYQRMRIASHEVPEVIDHRFNYNFPEYFETCFRSDSAPLTSKPQYMKLDNPVDYDGSLTDYARETILWGRKSGTMLTNVVWKDLVR